MISRKKLYHLTTEDFRMPYRVDVNGNVFTSIANNIPMVSWPDGRPCHEANLYLLLCFERGLSRKEAGGTLAQYAKLISHLIRFCFYNKNSFLSLTDSSFSMFIRSLQGEMDSQKPGEKSRSAAHVSSIGRVCLSFLFYIGSLNLESSFVGPTGTIRAEKREYRIFSHGRFIAREYWHHHSFPSPEPKVQRLPISSVNIRKMVDAIPNISVTTFQRKRRFILVKLLEITGARRVEVGNIKIEDIYNARLMPGGPSLKVVNAKRPGGKEDYRYLPVSRVDIELVINYIEKFRRRVINKTVGFSKDRGFLLVSERTGTKLATETLTNEILLISKGANIEEQACAHMFRHRFITKLFVAFIEQHNFENSDDFRRALLDGESLKKKVQEYTGHSSLNGLEPYIHLAFEEVSSFKRTLNVIKAKLAVESLKSNVEEVEYELNSGRSVSEVVELLRTYVDCSLRELDLANFSDIHE